MEPLEIKDMTEDEYLGYCIERKNFLKETSVERGNNTIRTELIDRFTYEIERILGSDYLFNKELNAN